MQGAVARGLEAAGKNGAGSAMGFMGMGMGMQAAGDVLSSASRTNRQQMQEEGLKTGPAAPRGNGAGGGAAWTCACGQENTGKFCSECGKPRPQTDVWVCSCGQENTGKFCSECGKPRPAAVWTCKCGQENTGKFCSECGSPRP